MPILNDYRDLPDDAPRALVIMLHGVGANGQDLIELSTLFRAALPGAAFLAPDAPEAYDMAPFGRQWFSLADWTAEKIAAGIEKSAPILHAYISAALTELMLPASRCALLGFSQGTMMALHAGPRHLPPLAGVLGYSGALFGAPAAPPPAPLPIALLHGTDDPVVPVTASQQAAEALRAAGHKVDLHLYNGLGHSIDARGIEAGAAFLQRILS